MTPLRLFLAVGLFATTVSADEIKLNAEYEGKFPGAAVQLPNKKGWNVYRATVEVQLEAGHPVTVTAMSADGTDRAVGLGVYTNDGQLVCRSFPAPFAKAGRGTTPEQLATQFGMAVARKGETAPPGDTAKADIPSVPTNGRYTVQVLSNFSGRFKLVVTDPKAKPAARDAAAIQKEIDELEKRLAALRAELKAATVGK